MGADNTRFTFNAARDYAAVVKQQGRVDLDADWNEHVDMVDRRWRAETIDIAGRCVVAKDTPDAFKIEGSVATFKIHRGRFYVDGLLAENHGKEPFDVLDAALDEMRSSQPLGYDAQPYFPTPTPLPLAQGGPHLVYVDVWRQREVNHVQDPNLLEKALGGVDTTTRLQTVWQVKVLENAGIERCDEKSAKWDALVARPAGRLTTSAVAPPVSDDPCVISPAGGYRGLENRLYRVEIHVPGPLGTAKFKWSRDNGSIVSAVEGLAAGGDALIVRRIGRDAVLRFAEGDWVELLDDHAEFAGIAGHMAEVTAVNEATRTLMIDPPVPASSDFDPSNPDRHTRVRRWDQKQNVDASGLLDVTAGPIDIEDGIQVVFSADPVGGQFRVGDHWEFAGRTADGSVEPLEKAPPRGIYHHFCRLALIRVTPERVVVMSDCRPQPVSTTPPPSAAGVHIIDVTLTDGKAIHNDAHVSVAALAKGLRVMCDDHLDPGTVRGKPTCFVTLELPYPVNDTDRRLWYPEAAGPLPAIGFQPLVLAAETTATGSTILWRPRPHVAPWLEDKLFQVLSKRVSDGAPPLRVLAHLALKGNVIWDASHSANPAKYLDGEAFGFRSPGSTNTDLRLPSGDGRPGGDFEMWFWLVPPGITVDASIFGNLIHGVLNDASGNPMANAAVTLLGAIGSTTVATDSEGRFRFEVLAAGTYRIDAQSGDLVTSREVHVTATTSRLDPAAFPGRTLEEVEGVGEVFAARLREHDITHPADVVNTLPPRLADILGVPVARALKLQRNARRLLLGS
jgi:hypothetical protein